ncbi:MAG: cbb3-type cytochrome c oxidase subunit I [Myxococcota bacterium]|nr:cbb3-type cytochrome c oxidase subunit I [Myxococcota bacterium]
MDLQPIHAPPTSFAKKYLFTIDHKVIAKQFIWGGFLFLVLGGGLAMLIRWQWAFPHEPVPVVGDMFLGATQGRIGPATYNSIFTNHGLIMIFWAITPLLIGAFGNFCIPLMIGARDMAFPLLNMLSFWIWALSGVMVLASFVVPLGAAGAGWTTYPPLSTNVGMPGAGQSLMVGAIFVTGVSTIMGGLNYVVTVIRYRAPGMTWMRMPLTVWGLWLTSILNVLFVPVLGSAGLLLLLDRMTGTQFFIAGSTGMGANAGDPILFQHLFWIFGHPEVYILILPAWGMVCDFVAFFARKPAYWYKGSVYAMTAVSVLSAVVYGHHMFTTGISPLLGTSFMLFTLIISVPAEMLFLNWLHTMWKGSIRLTSPMSYTLGVIWVFGLGGLTGLHLGTTSTDLYLHDTMWVVGHFHLTMASASFLVVFAGIAFWFPKMFGRMLPEKFGHFHCWSTVSLLTLVFVGQIISGYAGHHRRLFDPYQYTFLEHLLPLNRWVSYFAFALAAIQGAYAVVFIRSVFAGKKAEQNPWEVGTLEWTECTSPPAVHNFDTIPVIVRGPHEYANPEVRKVLGRDWISQTEPLGDSEQASGGAAAAGG